MTTNRIHIANTYAAPRVVRRRLKDPRIGCLHLSTGHRTEPRASLSCVRLCDSKYSKAVVLSRVVRESS
eukprot:scaffold6860_cov297-Chaetoceros_neogracile.AAC.27